MLHQTRGKIAHQSQSVVWHAAELAAPHFVSHFFVIILIIKAINQLLK
jgi:hypothetical protein